MSDVSIQRRDILLAPATAALVNSAMSKAYEWSTGSAIKARLSTPFAMITAMVVAIISTPILFAQSLIHFSGMIVNLGKGNDLALTKAYISAFVQTLTLAAIGIFFVAAAILYPSGAFACFKPENAGSTAGGGSSAGKPDLSRDLEAAQGRVTQLERRIRELTEGNPDLARDLEVARGRVIELETRIPELTNRLTELQNQVVRLTGERNENEALLEEARNRNENAAKIVAHYEQVVGDLSKRLKEVGSARNALQEAHAQLEGELRLVSDTLERERASHAQLTESYRNDLTAKQIALEATVQEKEELLVRYRQLEQTLVQGEEEQTKAIRAQLDEYHVKIEKLNTEMDLARRNEEEQFSRFEQLKQELTAAIKQLQQDKAALSQTLSEKDRDIQMLDNVRERLVQENESAKRELTQSAAIVAEQKAALRQQTLELAQKHEEHEVLKTAYAEMETRIEEHRRQILRLEETLETTIAIKDGIVNENAVMRSVVESFKEEMGRLSEENKALKTRETVLRGELEPVLAENNELGELVAALRNEIEGKNHLVATIQAEIARLTTKLGTLEEANGSSQEQQVAVRELRAALGDREAQLETLRGELSRKELEVEDLTAQRRVNEEQVESINRELAEIRALSLEAISGFETKKREVEELNALLVEKNEKLSLREVEIERFRAEGNQARSLLQIQADDLARKQVEISRLQNELMELSKTWAPQFERQRIEFEERLAEKEVEKERLMQGLEEANAKREDFKRLNGLLENSVKQLEREKQEIENALQEKEAHLASIAAPTEGELSSLQEANRAVIEDLQQRYAIIQDELRNTMRSLEEERVKTASLDERIAQLTIALEQARSDLEAKPTSSFKPKPLVPPVSGGATSGATVTTTVTMPKPPETAVIAADPITGPYADVIKGLRSAKRPSATMKAESQQAYEPVAAGIIEDDEKVAAAKSTLKAAPTGSKKTETAAADEAPSSHREEANLQPVDPSRGNGSRGHRRNNRNRR